VAGDYDSVSALSKDIQRDVEVQEHLLDQEWKRQPELVFKYGMMLADARRELQRAERMLVDRKNELSRDIRENPEAYGLAKVTESAIQTAIELDKRYLDWRDEIDQLRYEVGVLAAAMEALQHKRRALEKLVDLYLADYYEATPKVKAADKDKVQKKATRRRVRIGGKQK